jgi:hypothetical protein
MPLFDPPRHDSAETIQRALNLGVNVKMITGTSFGVFRIFRQTNSVDAMPSMLPYSFWKNKTIINIVNFGACRSLYVTEVSMAFPLHQGILDPFVL